MAAYDNFELPFSMTSVTAIPTRLEDAVEGLRRSLHQPRTPLFDAFFAITNIDVLQNRVRATIQQRSGFAIDRQSDTDLMLIMRRVFTDSANVGAPVPAEVARMNDVVLFVVVPMVASGVAGYLAYLRDASRLPVPMARGEQTSVKGTKTFELFRGL